jgi:hypothetical protein
MRSESSDGGSGCIQYARIIIRSCRPGRYACIGHIGIGPVLNPRIADISLPDTFVSHFEMNT